MSNDEFKRVLKILLDVWDRAGEQATAQGLAGDQKVQAQGATLEALLNEIHNTKETTK